MSPAPVNALLIVPPLVKAISGPPLGPAMLAGAAHARGHETRVLDLNDAWWRGWCGDGFRASAAPFVGDHDRPTELLRRGERDFWTDVSRRTGLPLDIASSGRFDHAVLSDAAERLDSHPLVDTLARELACSAFQLARISIMYAGQVIWAAALTAACRRRMPSLPIVWGGPHVTALRDAIASDPGFGEFADGFVVGYAERTWVDLLDAVAVGGAWPAEVNRAGAATARNAIDDPATRSLFDEIRQSVRTTRLTLPAQSSRGCVYGRCTYCTYPAIEGAARDLPEDGVDAVLAAAERLAAPAVSFKDSLIPPKRLLELADRIGGRVQWSACTKLHVALREENLRRLRSGGCHTLEVGLETLHPSGQKLIDKKQSEAPFIAVVESTARAGIALVVNYMTGFPGLDQDEEGLHLSRVKRALAQHPAAKLEENTMEYERLSTLGRRRLASGQARTWPWASLIEPI